MKLTSHISNFFKKVKKSLSRSKPKYPVDAKFKLEEDVGTKRFGSRRRSRSAKRAGSRRRSRSPKRAGSRRRSRSPKRVGSRRRRSPRKSKSKSRR